MAHVDSDWLLELRKTERSPLSAYLHSMGNCTVRQLETPASTFTPRLPFDYDDMNVVKRMGSMANARIHHYTPKRIAIEYILPNHTTEPKNALVFIGGLDDGPGTVAYVSHLVNALPSGWALFEPRLTASYHGWATSSLDQDVRELESFLSYMKTTPNPPQKTVFMGHSTGCQSTMHYLTSPLTPGRQRILPDAAVLQAPVSDREAFNFLTPKEPLENSIKVAKDWISRGKGQDCLPAEVTKPLNLPFSRNVTASRWYSLTSPGPDHDGQDDYFSSDLPLARIKKTFGKIAAIEKMRLMILIGGSDEYMPKSIDKQALLHKWTDVMKNIRENSVDSRSAVVEGADHDLSKGPASARQDVIDRVVHLLNDVAK